MKLTHLSLIVCGITAIAAIAAAQQASKAIVVNLDSANWSHEKGAPPDTEGVMLHADPVTGAMELLVRFPAGHVIPPHYHDSNERVIVVEGQLTLRRDAADTFLNPGGFAWLPAGEVQRLSCSSKTRCTFYLLWDGKPDSHSVK
jgi:quercetin dioxygenase-like cupin family protein